MRRSRETSQEASTVIQTRSDGGASRKGKFSWGCGSREEGQQRACPRACTDDLTDEWAWRDPGSEEGKVSLLRWFPECFCDLFCTSLFPG